MKLKYFLLVALILALGVAVLIVSAVPDFDKVETLIAIEQSWLSDSDNHAGKADELADGRKCWRVEKFDFHGQQIWEAWRCTVLEGPSIGTIQWEWRSP